MSLQEDIDHLEAHLADKYDIFVSFAHNDVNGCSEEDKIITINSQQSLETRLYTLLHEAGHVVLYEEYDHRGLFPSIIYQPFKKRFSQASAVDVVRNEVLAWEVAYELAGTLGIEVDNKKWNNLRKKCLYEYCKWAARG
tara:strand:+ start:345 stop:761 length:417 start_codon:yes stop_codon:yes gene_type:complete